ncbi:MAG: hypothetical protein AMJ90_07970 [candidate division Zixibacteria bacterium SM23_73_2]|nr:MAG: hypothetical protein AMJ90_07970 [candidate division Zixibacteria bacterium SM23_73_2]
MEQEKKIDLEGRELVFETGRIARQADGACLVRLGDTMILATAVANKEVKEEAKLQGFFPLTVDYREKAYAAGKIPGGFFKREGRPSEKEILSSRLVDRSIRPLFPQGYFKEVQVIVFVLSSDQENDSDVLGINGASLALSLSSIPFSGPIGAVRIGRVNHKQVINPTFSELEQSDMNIVVTGTEDSIIMVEGFCNEVSEDELHLALDLSHNQIKKIIEGQKQMQKELGQLKEKPEEISIEKELQEAVEGLAKEAVKQANHSGDKNTRQKILDDLYESITEKLADSFPEKEPEISYVLAELEKKDLRRMILEEKARSDGRDYDTIRPISCEVGILPRAHGSALFTRGQTQCLVAITLGTKIDEQIVDDLEGESSKSYMLHYNFPPFSVGEVKFLRAPQRREVGHGALAERAIQPMIPKEEAFPYTVRIVSDILESNGSSSMATVCGGSLSLMDAGVPIKAPVAGIAMGLLKEEEKVAILTDILGVEDHSGDMDFKVAGSRKGITAFQMDTKISGIELEILKEALLKARDARLFILEVMEKTISKPRESLSVYAPRIIILKIRQDKIGDVIGPGGKTIRGIIEKTGAKIDIEDDGSIFIATPDQKAAELAQEMILKLVEEPELGKIYEGKVTRILPFGALVEILPGQEGLVHISELDNKRVYRVEDILNLGDRVKVKVLGIEPDGKIKLSRKACLRPSSVRTRRD